MNYIKMPYVTRVSVAILFFLIVAVALYFESKPQPSTIKIDQYLTGAEIDDRIESIESDLIEQVKTLESKLALPKNILYDYKTTIVSINIAAGQNVYERFNPPGPEWRMVEWISIEQAGVSVTFGILWEKETIN